MRKAGLRHVLSISRAILFDFDGPMCSVFAGIPAAEVAGSLVGELHQRSVAVDMSAFDADDPLAVLRYAARFGRSVVADVEDQLVRAELEAVRSAAPTPAGARSLRACVTSGRLAAVVSNNSAAAVAEYLTGHDLAGLVHTVVGRQYGAPHRMKPNAEPVERALSALSVKPAASVLVGDSPSDIAAARAATTSCIGFAREPAKWRRLAGADVIIDDMATLAVELESGPMD